MKEVKAYVRSAMRSRVIGALERLHGLKGFAVVPVEEFGHEVGTGELTRIDMVKIEIQVADQLAEMVADCIIHNGRTGTGHPGDGRIVILEVEDTVRIDDGARGDAAL